MQGFATRSSTFAENRIQRVIAPGVPEPAPGLWSNCLQVGNQIFISGIVACDANNTVIGEGDPGEQARAIFGSIRQLMEAAGGQMSGVVSLTIYLTDMKHRPAVLEARREFFKGDFPCSTLIQVSALIDPKLLVEINAVGFV